MKLSKIVHTWSAGKITKDAIKFNTSSFNFFFSNISIESILSGHRSAAINRLIIEEEKLLLKTCYQHLYVHELFQLSIFAFEKNFENAFSFPKCQQSNANNSNSFQGRIKQIFENTSSFPRYFGHWSAVINP